MPNQVNPLGSLPAGVLQTVQVAAKPPSASSEKPSPERTSPVIAADAQALEPEKRSLDASKESLDAAAAKINDYFKSSRSDLEFSVDKETGTVVFKIVNASTREVIRQVPAEEALSMARKLRQLSHPSGAAGVLMDEKG